MTAEPASDCLICPRLAAYRASNRAMEPGWHNAPVRNFAAAEDVRLLVVGLAPGLRGANRTGRPFTGDYAGDLLYEALIEFGFATGAYLARADDGLRLIGVAITNAVRCAPPQNKPTPQEINSCRPFLAATLESFPDLRAVLALGRIAHDSTLRAFGAKLSGFPFAHGAEHALGTSGAESITLFDSYHCSRYNTNTGVLTPLMFREVFARLRTTIDTADASHATAARSGRRA